MTGNVAQSLLQLARALVPLRTGFGVGSSWGQLSTTSTASQCAYYGGLSRALSLSSIHHEATSPDQTRSMASASKVKGKGSPSGRSSTSSSGRGEKTIRGEDAEGNHSVKIVLRKDVRGLGAAGETVIASAGIMRHRLYPAGLAAYATPENIAQAQGSAAALAREETEEEQRKRLEKLIKALAKRPVIISRSAALGSEALPDNRLVQPADVIAAVAKQLRIQLDASHMLFADAINAFGTFKIPLNLRDASDKQVQLTIHVDRRQKHSLAAAAAGTASGSA